jgi:phosphomannomutase
VDLSPIFKAYDVRGTYPDQLNEDAFERIGAALARVAGAGSLAVGRDMRPSSPQLAQAFIQGVTGQGVDVVDLGLVSTDALYYASGALDVPGAMITASHNPSKYNGAKMCLPGAAPIGQDTGLAEIRALAEQGLLPVPERGKVTERDIVSDFVDHLLGAVDSSSIGPLTVAVDCANGMGGKMVPPVFERLPVKLVPLYFELDGTFPNHPADPIQEENLVDLQAAIKANQAHVGLAFDGDADRVFLVDEQCAPASPSVITALVAAQILADEPGASIVYSLICSRIVPETIIALGGKPIRTRVGHSFIKKVMADTGAAFGGEHSGHYYFRRNFRADSGLMCALYVLSALSRSGKLMSEVLAPYRKYWNSGEINIRVTDQQAALHRLEAEYPDGEHDLTDGLTVSYPSWWFNVRGSNTEPLLRLNVEAEDPQLGSENTERLVQIISSFSTLR